MSVGVVGEGFGGAGNENSAGGGVDDIGGVGAGRVDGGVDLQFLPKIGGCVIRAVAAVEVGAALRRSLGGFAAEVSAASRRGLGGRAADALIMRQTGRSFTVTVALVAASPRREA